MRNVEVGHCARRSRLRWRGDLLCACIVFFSELNFCTKFQFQFRVIWNDFSYLGRSRRGAVADYAGRKASFPPGQTPALKRQRSVTEWLEWSSWNDKSFKSDMKAHCWSKRVWHLPPNPLDVYRLTGGSRDAAGIFLVALLSRHVITLPVPVLTPPLALNQRVVHHKSWTPTLCFSAPHKRAFVCFSSSSFARICIHVHTCAWVPALWGNARLCLRCSTVTMTIFLWNNNLAVLPSRRVDINKICPRIPTYIAVWRTALIHCVNRYWFCTAAFISWPKQMHFPSIRIMLLQHNKCRVLAAPPLS